MVDISTPKEFLLEALTAVDTLKEDKTAQAENQVKLKEAERALNTLKKTIEKEKNDTVKARRNDIESDYTKQLKASESSIQKAESERAKARTKSINERINEALIPAKTEIKDYRDQISAVVSSSGLPLYCKTKAFYTLFAAKGIGELLVLVVLFLLVLVALPLLVISFIKGTALKIIIFVAIDVVAVGLYLLIYSGTVAKKQDAVNLCRGFIDKIKADEKAIKKITKSIKNDKDDSSYNLSNFDTEIARLTAVRDEITQKRQQALSEFDVRTADTIKTEIDSRYAGKLAETQDAFDTLSGGLKALADKITAEEMEVSKYIPFVGAKNLNHESLQKMVELVESGQAESVSDAALKIKQ